jgi:hypothetical protein
LANKRKKSKKRISSHASWESRQSPKHPESNEPSWWKCLSTRLFSALALLSAVVTIAPKLQMTVKENPPNVFNAEFIVENKGMFTLDKCSYRIFGEWSLAEGVITKTPEDKGQFSAPPLRALSCGQIPSGQSRTLTFPIQFANSQWTDDAFVCFGIFFRVFGFWHTQSDSFCFSAEKKPGLDHWVPRPPKTQPKKQ